MEASTPSQWLELMYKRVAMMVQTHDQDGEERTAQSRAMQIMGKATATKNEAGKPLPPVETMEDFSKTVERLTQPEEQEDGVLVSKWEGSGNDKWIGTEYEQLGAKLHEMHKLLLDNVGYYAGVDNVEMSQVLMSMATEWAVLEEAVLRVSYAAPRHDVDPSIPGNGYRSLLTVTEACTCKILRRLRDIASHRKNIFFFQMSSYLADLEEYSSVLHTLRKMLQYAVLTDSLSDRHHLFLPVSESEIEAQAISSFAQFDNRCFYGKRVAFYFYNPIRSAFCVIISAMAGYGAGFHSPGIERLAQNSEEQDDDSLVSISPDSYSPTPDDAVQPAPRSASQTLAGATAAVAHGVGCLFSPSSRAESVAERFRNCDVAFAKGFWSLTETAPLAQHTGSVVSPWMAVNHTITVPITEQALLDCFDDGPMGPLLADAMLKPLEQLGSIEEMFRNCVVQGLVSEVEQDQFNKIFASRRANVSFSSSLSSISGTPVALGSGKPPLIQKLQQGLADMVINAVQGDRNTADTTGLGAVNAQLLSFTPPSEESQGEGARRGLVIHIHGGGFVAQSPKSHEVYLRHWTKQLKVPILSIDYSLAPEAWFPRAVDECYHVYLWATKNRKELGAGDSGRIILTGDSAGGNLAIAVALKAAMKGVRKPDGVVCAYPALNVKLAASPSRMLALMDALLPLGLLECCLKAYVGPRLDYTTHPLMSPMHASDEQLNGLPPVRIVASELDPLLDDSVVFIRRMKAIGADGELDVVPRMPHGFLNLAYLGGGDGALEAVRVIVSHLEQLLAVPCSNDDDLAALPSKVKTSTGSLVAQHPEYFCSAICAQGTEAADAHPSNPYLSPYLSPSDPVE